MTTRAEIEAGLEAITPEPWAYESVGEKLGEYIVGVCVGPDDQQVAGEIVERYNEDTGEFIDDVIRVAPIGEEAESRANAHLIAHAPTWLRWCLAELDARDALLREVYNLSHLGLTQVDMGRDLRRESLVKIQTLTCIWSTLR